MKTENKVLVVAALIIMALIGFGITAMVRDIRAGKATFIANAKFAVAEMVRIKVSGQKGQVVGHRNHFYMVRHDCSTRRESGVFSTTEFNERNYKTSYFRDYELEKWKDADNAQR